MQQSQINSLLREGIEAAKAAQQQKTSARDSAEVRRLKSHAQDLLLQVTEMAPDNVQAWLWLSTVVDKVEDKRVCLNNVLALEPDNETAQKGLILLEQQGAAGTLAAMGLAGQKVKCPFCQKPIAGTEPACPHCKTPLVVECPHCNTLMDVEQPRCTRCGHELGDYRLKSVYFTLLANDYQAHHRLSRALEALRVAERLNPDQPDLYRQMGELLTELSQPLEAIVMLEKAVDKEPEQMGPYLALGRVLQQEGKWNQAERIYRTAMKRAPDSSETYYALGDLLFHHSRLDESEKLLKKATALEPKHGEAWARLGQLYEQERKQGAAVRAYRRAQKYLLPDSQDRQQVRERLVILDPQLPDRVARSWSMLLRQMAGPILLTLGAVAVGSFLPTWTFNWLAVVAVAVGIVGVFLWVTAYSLPKNPVIVLLTGNHEGISHLDNPLPLAVVGGLMWLLSIGMGLLL